MLPIWEGTTNVLSLDTLRALAKEGALEALHADVERRLAAAKDVGLKPCVEAAHDGAGARAGVGDEGDGGPRRGWRRGRGASR